jgi:hypothetical protein
MDYQQGKVINSTRAPFSAPPTPSEIDLPVRYDPSSPDLPPTDILSEEEQLAALCQATGQLPNLGKSESWYAELKEKPAYRELVRRTVRKIAERNIDEAENVPEMFNSQIRSNVVTLAEIRDNPFAKEGDRIKAATVLLDKAPKTPRPNETGNVDDFLKLIMPVQQMGAINAALKETGNTRLIEMMKKGEGGYGVEETKEGEEEFEENLFFSESKRGAADGGEMEMGHADVEDGGTVNKTDEIIAIVMD